MINAATTSMAAETRNPPHVSSASYNANINIFVVFITFVAAFVAIIEVIFLPSVNTLFTEGTWII